MDGAISMLRSQFRSTVGPHLRATSIDSIPATVDLSQLSSQQLRPSTSRGVPVRLAHPIARGG